MVIPESLRMERMEQNFDVFDFTHNNADTEAIRKLDGGEDLFFSHYDPAIVKKLTNLH